MTDNAVIERWNVVDSAAMAVGVEGVLYRRINGKPDPFDFEDSLNNGVEFLTDASNAGAIICGSSESSGFTGTLSPLRWSTNVYIEFGHGESEPTLYSKVVETLKKYKLLLENIRGGEDTGVDKKTYMEAHQFFQMLADDLMKQSDPITRTYSHSAT